MDRFHIMSPCKTDLVVEFHDEDEGFCKCEELYESDRAYYKIQKIICEGQEMGLDGPYPINADGTCPETYTWFDREIQIAIDAYDTTTHEGKDTFWCSADEDQQECIDKFMHEDGCVDSDPDDDYDDCLRDQYRNCYHRDKGTVYCDSAPHPAWCDDEGHCSGDCDITMNNINFCYVPYSMHKDAFAVPVNFKPHVNVDKSDEPVTVCTNSWSLDFLDLRANPTHKEPCISVEYDVDSMRGYSKGGFGMNYCAENHAQFEDAVEGACFWGGIVGAVAVSVIAGPGAPVAATVLVPVAIGSVGTACEKIVQMKTKWPHDQY